MADDPRLEAVARALAALSYAQHIPGMPDLWIDDPTDTPKQREAIGRLRASYLERSLPFARAALAEADKVQAASCRWCDELDGRTEATPLGLWEEVVRLRSEVTDLEQQIHEDGGFIEADDLLGLLPTTTEEG